MSEPIKPGDLVIVIRDGVCVCGGTGPGDIGRIFLVGAIRMSHGRVCTDCHRKKPDTIVATPEERITRNGYDLIFSLDRLKRIPPLSELDDVKRDEEIAA